MQSLITSYIRTYVPVLVGSLLSYLVTLGVQLDKDAENGLVVALTAFIIGVYYALARTLEKKWPAVGTLLLGSSKQPTYREVQK